MIKKIISVLIFLMLASQVFAAETVTRHYGKVGPTTLGLVDEDDYTFGSTTVNTRTDTTPADTSFLTTTTGYSINTENFKERLLNNDDLEHFTNIWANAEATLITTYRTTNYQIVVHNLPATGEIILTAIDLADFTNVFSTKVTESTGKKILAYDAAFTGEADDSAVCGVYDLDVSKYPFCFHTSVDAGNEDFDITTASYLAVSNVGYDAMTSTLKITMGANEEGAITYIIDNADPAVILVDFNDNVNPEDGFYLAVSPVLTSFAMSEIIDPLSTPILVLAANTGGSMEYLSTTITAGAFGLTNGQVRGSTAGEVSAYLNIRSMLDDGNKDLLVAGSATLADGVTRRPFLQLVDAADASVDVSSTYTSTSINPKMAMSDGDILLASGDKRVDAVIIDPSNGDVIESYSMDEPLKNDIGVVAVGGYFSPNDNAPVWTIAYRSGAMVTETWLSKGKFKGSQVTQITGINPVPTGTEIVLDPTDPDGFEIYPVEEQTTLLTANTGFFIMIYNVTANPDVPEFSIPTLLLATLLAGGLVLFVVRRRK